MDENKNIVLTITFEGGTVGKRELLSIFSADNGRKYAALLPLNDDETVQTDANIELVRVTPFINDDDKDDYIIEGITTDEELSTAKEAFDKLPLVEIGADEDSDIGDLPTVSFVSGNGEAEDWRILDVFDHDNRKYIALIPESEINERNINIHLMRLELTNQNGEEGCEVSSIPSDMEYEEVLKVFESRIADE